MKFNKDSKLEVNKVVEEFTDEFGRTHRKISTEVQKGDLNLGSLMNPKNKDIIQIKYSIPPKEKKKEKISGFDFSDVFG